ncbi:hypothetical protein Dda_1824 [Drechslerella dactyloides]|uniref:HMG box domain-containing protein n=1 Tax=Drechslerella dactyloides TaxID=74499 RepID=A0AAD6J2D9_DREDA|nr:hypothetical protein Dda_1824 [Drechslerella dactyloides]
MMLPRWVDVLVIVTPESVLLPSSSSSIASPTSLHLPLLLLRPAVSPRCQPHPPPPASVSLESLLASWREKPAEAAFADPCLATRLQVHHSSSTLHLTGTQQQQHPSDSKAMVNSSPALPASVEEAYRAKCVDLKKRLKECENSNDVLVIRNHRLRRGIQRLRLERALLLREIERRIDPRMDDSDGTPSPPPTPHEKPLRLKRPRRDGLNGPSDRPDSPFSQANLEAEGYGPVVGTARSRTPLGGRFGPARDRDQKPRNAYTIFCDHQRDELMKNATDPEFDISRELSKAWQELTPTARQPYFDEAEDERLRYQAQRYEARMATVAYNRQRAALEAEVNNKPGPDETFQTLNNSVDGDKAERGDPMAVEEDYPSFVERDDTPPRAAPSASAGGFTAVNQRSFL